MPRFLLLALLLACTAVRAQLLVKDDAGRNLLVRHHFTRIVTLAPFITEAAYAAGAGDLVVGADVLSNYPDAARRLPRVPTGAGFSLDAVAALKPDLVVAWKGGIRMEDVDAMTSFGATVYLAEARTLEDVPRLLQSIGALTGRNSRDAATTYESRLKELRRAMANKPRLTLFLEIWNRPLTTVGGDSLLSEAVLVCRGENVFGTLRGMAPQVDYEEVRQANPYLILGVNSANNAEDFHGNWATHRGIRAVQSDHLIYIESETLQRPSLRTLDSIGRLCAEMDQVRLHDSLIAASEAYSVAKGPVAEADAASEVLRRPMTTIERDVAAVLASTYAVSPTPPEPAAKPAPAAAAVPVAPATSAVAQAVPAPPQREPPVALAAAAPESRGAPPARKTEQAADSSSYTQVARYGDLYFISGQIALDPASGRFAGDTGIADQTRTALENVRRLLEGERLTMANVVSTTVFLRRINDLAAMDEAYEGAFRTRLPARTVVEATNLPRGALVEIAVVAGR
ncbi:MAG TPA: helical backbone metal receptor [Usitatibacter sp.]|jgi:iron complex transport system substrate-binding protein|nr:helical backbone metal receptor [Usitatibacter sp.]